MKHVHAVAAIIVDNDLIFAAQRGSGEMRGGWEFPGGKIEPHETPEEALRREIQEELDVTLSTMWFLDTTETDYDTFHLTLDAYVVRLATGATPTLTEHTDARWLTREELTSLDWLAADRPLAESLAAHWDVAFSSEPF